MSKKTTPTVSILIISYNQEQYIAEAIESAAEQDYENLEVVIADDCSTDGTPDIIREFKQKYPNRIKAILGTSNLGITGNSNRGLQACRGEFFGYMGGDDVLLPSKIRKQVEWLSADPQRVLCGHDIEEFASSPNGEVILGRYSQRGFPLTGKGASQMLRYGVLFGCLSVLLRASTIPKWGFEQRLPIISDQMLWIDCLAQSGSFGYIPEVLGRYRKHKQQISNITQQSNEGWLKSREDLFNTISLAEARYPHLLRDCQIGRARLFYTCGIHAMRTGDFLSAQRFYYQSIRLNPLSLKSWARFLHSSFVRLKPKG